MSGSRVGAIPFREMGLRYTSALDAKWNKGTTYRKTGVVGPNDAYVIAVDGCQLARFPILGGVSRLPFVVENAFMVGPLELSIGQETGKIGPAYLTIEHEITNRNGSRVSKAAFLDSKYAGVSAVLGHHTFGPAEPLLPLSIAHNPLADVPIDYGTFDLSAQEWRPVRASDAEAEFWQLHVLPYSGPILPL